MRCPECHSLNEDGAAACSTCGLLLLKAFPKRRAEDQAAAKRRATDHSVSICRYCAGEVTPTAVRCFHCSEILNDDYFRNRAQKLRARINYASWVAYIFGLGALVIFRPVGLLSIAAGLLLSIAYYAIPVEPMSRKRGGKNGGAAAFLKRQLKLERVSIPIPNMRNKKLVFVGTPLVAAIVGYSANLLLLQEPMNDILKKNSAFQGMNVSAHYQYWVVPGVVVYDLKELSVKQTPIDVHTAFLEFAKELKARRYKRVELSYQGVTKFSIDGAGFKQIGEEYSKRNFDYVLYRVPKLFRREAKTAAPANGTDRDALLQFHRQWYGDDPLTKAGTVQNGM